MPMFEINRQETGVIHKTYRILAPDEETAEDILFDEEVAPQTEYFKQHDANTQTRELPDCDCDICERRGPWACQEETDFVGGEVNYDED